MRDSLAIAAIAGLAVLCCAGPALLAAGVLGGLGAWLLSPWLIGAVALLALGVVGWRHRHRSTARREPVTAGDVLSGGSSRPGVDDHRLVHAAEPDGSHSDPGLG